VMRIESWKRLLISTGEGSAIATAVGLATFINFYFTTRLAEVWLREMNPDDDSTSRTEDTEEVVHDQGQVQKTTPERSKNDENGFPNGV
jgi:hypothetical protein